MFYRKYFALFLKNNKISQCKRIKKNSKKTKINDKLDFNFFDFLPFSVNFSERNLKILCLSSLNAQKQSKNNKKGKKFKKNFQKNLKFRQFFIKKFLILKNNNNLLNFGKQATIKEVKMFLLWKKEFLLFNPLLNIIVKKFFFPVSTSSTKKGSKKKIQKHEEITFNESTLKNQQTKKHPMAEEIERTFLMSKELKWEEVQSITTKKWKGERGDIQEWASVVTSVNEKLSESIAQLNDALTMALLNFLVFLIANSDRISSTNFKILS
ncbi:hypothetical protein RFI_23363, partial [Reticulomyxa filosa]